MADDELTLSKDPVREANEKVADQIAQAIADPPMEWGVLSDRDGEIVVRCETKADGEKEAKRLRDEQVGHRDKHPPNVKEMADMGMEVIPPTTYRVEKVPAIVAPDEEADR